MYKYRILYYLNKLSPVEKAVAMNFLPDQCQTTRRNFERWIYRPIGDSTEIPAGALQIIAAFFGIDCNDLFSQPVSAREIREKWEGAMNEELKDCFHDHTTPIQKDR